MPLLTWAKGTDWKSEKASAAKGMSWISSSGSGLPASGGYTERVGRRADGGKEGVVGVLAPKLM